MEYEEYEVTIISGSESDSDYVRQVQLKLIDLDISYQSAVISAHRDLEKLRSYVKETENNKTKVFITLAGMAAALPGVVAAMTDKPVIGVPLPGGFMDGMDALMSIVQMPKGVPVATMAVGTHGAINAAIFAGKILA